MGKVIAVVIAQNEEKSIKQTLTNLNLHKRNGIIDEIVVINDASRDATAKIAKEMGAVVFNHASPKGKRGAFVTGAFKSKAMGASTMLVFDADILNLPNKTIKKMVSSVKDPKKCLMATAQQHEGIETQFGKTRSFEAVADGYSNAQRAINLVALEPLFRGNKKWIDFLVKENSLHRWGLEFALEKLVPKNKKVFLTKYPVYTRPAYAKDKPVIVRGGVANKQAESRNFIRRAISARNSLARDIKQKRRK